MNTIETLATLGIQNEDKLVTNHITQHRKLKFISNTDPYKKPGVNASASEG